MTTRTSSSSSSAASSDSEAPRRERNFSETSRDVSQSESRVLAPSATNTIDGTSIADTATLRTIPSPASHVSRTTSGTGTAYDSVSMATTTNTGLTNATTPTQQPAAGGIPIIRPPILQQQTSTGTGVFGPQRPTGYPTQPPVVPTNVVNQQPIRIDVAAAQQQYQQHGLQPKISPYSGSTASTSGGSLSSPGTASIQQQPHAGPAHNIINQADLNKVHISNSQEFRPQTQGGFNQAHGQFFHHQQQQQPQQYQQQQYQTQPQFFPNQIPAHQVYNELLGPDAFKDVIVDIDYGAMGGFNAAFQSGMDFVGGQLPPGINVRPAYTPVDALHFQQHMFNTARTVHAGGDNFNFPGAGLSGDNFNFSGAGLSGDNFNFSGAGLSGDIGGTGDIFGGQQFDVGKAMFNQANINLDGTIGGEEFQQWAQGGGGQQNIVGQPYGAAANYQTNVPSYATGNDSFYHATLFDGADPGIANILQQSGLGQVVPNQ
ncbi:unnamed protein product [Rotaria sp. Silwood1]|nr:unnamed protein product [Rotaria sp. Silwood1]CAF4761146.1 unnamed protein product [Rotaria sp. Silwood1]